MAWMSREDLGRLPLILQVERSPEPDKNESSPEFRNRGSIHVLNNSFGLEARFRH